MTTEETKIDAPVDEPAPNDADVAAGVQEFANVRENAEEGVAEGPEHVASGADTGSSLLGKAVLVLSVLLGFGTGTLGLYVILLAGGGLSNASASGGVILGGVLYGVLGYLVGIREDFDDTSTVVASDCGAAAGFGHLGLILSIVVMVPGEFKHGALVAMALMPFGAIFVGAWFGDQMRPKGEDEGNRAGADNATA